MKLKELLEKYKDFEDYEVPEYLVEEFDEDIIGKLEQPKPTVWNLKDFDRYWTITNQGTLQANSWSNSRGDIMRRNVGNAFSSEDEAVREIERRKVETLLFKYGGRRYFKEDMLNYTFSVSFRDELNIVCLNHSPLLGGIYFDTREDIEHALNEIGKDRIIEAFFDVLN